MPVIRASVEKLGFKFTDVKILLNSHAHDDHVGGMALAQQLTGAEVLVMRGDDKTVASGADNRWKPTAVNRVLKDGDKVTLGGTTLMARLHARPHPRLHHLADAGARTAASRTTW